MKACTDPIKFFLLVVLLAVGPSACSDRGVDAPDKLGPVTSEEAQAYAATLIDAAMSCQHAKLREVFDVDAALRRAVRASTLNNRLQRRYFAELSPFIPTILTNFFQCGESESAPQMAVARYSERDGRTRILVGFSRESIAYFEFAVGKSSRGQVIADDVFNIDHEQLLSERLRDYVNMMAGDSQRTAELVETIQLFESSPAAALERVSQLSSTSQNSKHMRMWVLMALASGDAEEYQSARASFREDFPDHPPMRMLDIESQIFAGDIESALQSLDALEAELGTLPYLDDLRLAACMESPPHYARGLAIAREMVRVNPDQSTPYMQLVSAQIVAEEDAEALVTMRDITERFDLSWGPEAAQDPFFERFAQTPEWSAYQEWLTAYEAQFADEDADPVADESAHLP